ncbi:MAG: response regulator [Nitrospira sp.]|nr:response regulator [Nitrospira sp.]
MVQAERRTIDILLVEDNAADVRLAREALVEVKVPHHLHTVNDGEAALGFLRKAAPYADVPRPDLILLDLNIPKTHGLEVLKQIKNDPELFKIPVIVLTSSKAQEDVAASYGNYANSYVTKSVELEDYLRAMARLDDFWCTIAMLPSKEPPE